MQRIERPPRAKILFACVGIVALVGVVDYFCWSEILFSVFYLVPVSLAAWRLGKGYGLMIAALSVAVWIGGDLIAGAHYRNSFVPIWNACILLVFYGVVCWLLDNLHLLQQDLELKVAQRTQALTEQMMERERLEKEILEIGEQERRRIGNDIHDSLCQHLTATALAGQVLSQKLANKAAPESGDAHKIALLIEEGITMARNFAHGLHPVQVDAEGLMDAFRSLASNISQTSRVECVFECDTPVLVNDTATATNIFRIGQEAVANAVRHGKPSHISMTLARRSDRLTLMVEDDGVGLPENWDKRPGLGTRIMAHRASMIGATLSVEPNPTGGAMVACSLPFRT
jgi:signal transduction histidine kinase